MCKRVHMQKSIEISKAGKTRQTGTCVATEVYLVHLLTSADVKAQLGTSLYRQNSFQRANLQE